MNGGTIEVNGRMVAKDVPEVHPGNDVVYWTQIFPTCYKHKRDFSVPIKDLGVTFHFQGDLKENPKGKDKMPVCICGNGKFHPVVWGSLDTGKELVYECKVCGSKMRLWTE